MYLVVRGNNVYLYRSQRFGNIVRSFYISTLKKYIIKKGLSLDSALFMCKDENRDLIKGIFEECFEKEVSGDYPPTVV